MGWRPGRRRRQDRSGRPGLLGAGLLAVGLAAACSSGPAGPSADGSTSASTSATTTHASTSSLTPSQSSSRPTTTPPPTTTPLALAVHATAPPVDVPADLVDALLAGEVTDWSALGLAARPLRVIASPVVDASPAVTVGSTSEVLAAVRADAGVVGLLPATALDPTVRALSVGGVDPLRDPDAYPVQVPGPEPGEVVTLAFVGDVMLARGVGRVIAESGDPAAPLRPTAERLAVADVTVGTLESTLSRIGPPTQGGDSFGADPSVREGLLLAGFDVLSLAANHLGDYGTESIIETLRLVRETGIAPVGAGVDLAEAEQPVIIDVPGEDGRSTSIGFLAFNAIGETPRAAPGVPGALELRMGSRTGPLDPADLTAMQDRVRALADDVDLVVVMPHWGTQYTNVPEPDQQTVGRALVDAGAGLVVGGHPHWVQGVEQHEGDMVIHSLGNYVFDMDFMRETMEGVILDVTLWDGEVKAATFSPVRLDASFTPREIPHEDAASIMDLIWGASSPPFARP